MRLMDYIQYGRADNKDHGKPKPFGSLRLPNIYGDMQKFAWKSKRREDVAGKLEVGTFRLLTFEVSKFFEINLLHVSRRFEKR